MNLRPVSDSQVAAVLRDSTFSTLAAISFEARSASLAKWLADAGLRPEGAWIVQYETRAHPQDLDFDLRAASRSELMRLLLSEPGKPLNAYSTSDLQRTSREWLAEGRSDYVLVDFSCLTRVHLLALAGLLAIEPKWARHLLFFYATPESYSFDRHGHAGWRDTILLPVGEPSPFRREGHSRGIVLAGHDVERLSVALQEIEPGAGVFIFTNTEDRPDIMRRAQEINVTVSQRLLALRLPRAPGEPVRKLDLWQERMVNLTGFEALGEILREQAWAARDDDGPLVLYPFGPKPITLATALVLASMIEVSSWAVYPIPESYDVSYTRGEGKHSFFCIDSSELF